MNIYVVQGGIGKHIMFSSMIEKLSYRDGDKIIIASPYPELFKFHPNVEKSVMIHEPGFYDEYVKNTNNNVIYTEPYYSNYVKGETHLIEEWFKLNGLEYENDLPDLYMDDFAMEECERLMETYKNFIIVQFSGGQSPLNADFNKPHMGNSQLRDYPRQLAQKTVNLIKEKYPDLTIINYALPNEQSARLENTEYVESNFSFFIALTIFCKAFIGIDSSLQHFAANRHSGKKGIVLWGGTSPKCLGYEKNINLTNAKDGIHSMRPLCNPLGDIFNKDGAQWRPDDVECMNIEPELIVEKLDECLEFNEKIGKETKLTNICEDSSILPINEKTLNMLNGIQSQIQQLNTQYQTVIQSYIAAKDADGQYTLANDGKKLIKIK